MKRSYYLLSIVNYNHLYFRWKFTITYKDMCVIGKRTINILNWCYWCFNVVALNCSTFLFQHLSELIKGVRPGGVTLELMLIQLVQYVLNRIKSGNLKSYGCILMCFCAEVVHYVTCFVRPSIYFDCITVSKLSHIYHLLCLMLCCRRRLQIV